MNYFLLVYDRAKGKILGELRVFAERDGREADAFAARLAEMVVRRDQPDVEVVLFRAQSLDDLRKTHSRYFQSDGEILARIDTSAA